MFEHIATARRLLRRTGFATLFALSGFALLALPSATASAVAAQTADRIAYVLFAHGSRSTMMSGSTEDLHRARALRSGDEALLYVRRDGSAYVIRDAAVLRQAEAIFEPQTALGARQAELGSRQAALGAQQAALGARQAGLGAQQARLSLRQASASQDRADELGREQGSLGRKQDELGRQQGALGQQQDALGHQQDALGRQQDRLGRATDAKLRALVDDAVGRGAARRID